MSVRTLGRSSMQNLAVCGEYTLVATRAEISISSDLVLARTGITLCGKAAFAFGLSPIPPAFM